MLESWPHIQVHDPPGDGWPFRVFKSSPWTPPNITIFHNKGELSDGYLLLNPRSRNGHSMKQTAPFVIASNNELVYAFNETQGTNNLRVQQFKGKPHLAFWEGLATLGHGYGNFHLLDGRYQQSSVNLRANILPNLRNESALAGVMDFHDHEITPRGTVWVTAYNNTPVDLSPVGGSKDGWVIDSVIFELDIATGKTLFTWSALDHIPLQDSKLPIVSYMGDGTVDHPWDHFHINSMQDLGDNILINSRHTFSCYLISRKTGEIIWELNGSGDGGDFGPLPVRGQFRWQHNALAWNVTKNSMTISFFDNHNMLHDNGTLPSRGLLLWLALPPDGKTPPTILRNVNSPHGLYSDSQGSYNPSLSNGNQLLGYGPIPVVQEFGPGGDLRWEGRFGDDDRAQSYRAHKAEWHATPKDWDPSLFVEELTRGHVPGTVTLAMHVSWNGATEVDAWNVYTGLNGTAERYFTGVGRALKKGFETVLWLDVPEGSCAQVGAVEYGKEVRRSNVACG